MKQKILILGGAGYIGGYTTDYLVNEGYDVCVYDKLLYENHFLKNVKFVYGDIRDTEKVISVAKDYDVVIIMAALVGDGACAVDVESSKEINDTAVKNICDQLDESKHVIFMSTCSVYGAQLDLLNEESPTNPLSVYASTKIEAEKYIKKLNGTIFRLGTVYGVGDTHSRVRLDLVVNVLTEKSVFDKKITIFGGEQWRPLICVKDIAGYIEETIRRNIRGTYIVSEGNFTMKQLGQKVKQLIPDIELSYTDIKFEDARNYKVDNTKLYDTFIYRPKFTIESEVEKLKTVFEEGRIVNIQNSAYSCEKHLKKVFNKI